MSFYIQVPQPAVLYCPSAVAFDVADAIEEIFPMNAENGFAEDGFMVWNNSYIPFSYKYDLSVMYEDILFVIKKLKQENQGSYSFSFGSNTFAARWNLIWKAKTMNLTSQWQFLKGRIADEANHNCKYLECEIDVFINEFSKILKLVNDSINKSAITIEDRNDIQELINMIKIID